MGLSRPLEARDWPSGTLQLIPTEVQWNVSNLGNFWITAKIQEGKSFEDVIDEIDYTNGDASVQIDPRKEYELYLQGDTTSLLTESTRLTRQFKPRALNLYHWGQLK